MMFLDPLKEIPVAVEVDSCFPDAVTGAHAERGEPTLFIAPSSIVEVCRFLKGEQRFIRLSSITAVDWTPSEPRFEVVYNLHSLDRNERVRLKCWVFESECAM